MTQLKQTSAILFFVVLSLIPGWVGDLQWKHGCLLAEAECLPAPIRSPNDIMTLICDPRARAEDCDYLTAGGSYGTYQFGNTSMLDSLLAGIHILSIRSPKIRDLFQMDSTVSAVIKFLDGGRYSEAKALWLINLCLRTGDVSLLQGEFVTIRGYVGDHLANFTDLVRVVDYGEENTVPRPRTMVVQSILRQLEVYGEVKLLGSPINPTLILVHRQMGDGLPPLSITDDCDRTYNLQFLLLGRNASNHTVLCTELIGRWVTFDATATPPFRNADMCRGAERRDLYLAVYCM